MKDIVLLIPSLNPNEKLIRTVNGMLAAGFTNILLVNDGSDLAYMEPFEQLSKLDGVTVIGYDNNQGKGYALKYGFKYIIDHFPDAIGVVTADGDGQHLPEDCVKTALAMRTRNEIVLGCRDFSDKSVPARNKAGNKISIFVYNFLCGIKLSDTQTGLRAIPMRYLNELVDVEGARFEYETNVLLYMKAHDIHFSEQAISTVYEADSNKGSHYKVVSDSIKIYKPLFKFGGPRLLKFIIGSLLSTVIDLGLFTLFNWIVTKVFERKQDADFLVIIGSVFIATFVARVCSSLFNYFYNRKAVFGDRKTSKLSIVKYYALAVCLLGASTLAVSGISFLFGTEGIGRTVIKLFVDVILFMISYKVQREWVFK